MSGQSPAVTLGGKSSLDIAVGRGTKKEAKSWPSNYLHQGQKVLNLCVGQGVGSYFPESFSSLLR
jgi:hypothetical protein